jgi:hypothetical protein
VITADGLDTKTRKTTKATKKDHEVLFFLERLLRELRSPRAEVVGSDKAAA